MGKKSKTYSAGVNSGRLRPEGAAPRGPVLLACEKCEHRLAKEGRFRQIMQMQQAFDSIADEAQANGSGLRIFPVSCLDVCPRGAMAVARAAERGRGPAETMIVRTPNELREICEAMTSDGAEPEPSSDWQAAVDEANPSSTLR